MAKKDLNNAKDAVDTPLDDSFIADDTDFVDVTPEDAANQFADELVTTSDGRLSTQDHVLDTDELADALPAPDPLDWPQEVARDISAAAVGAHRRFAAAVLPEPLPSAPQDQVLGVFTVAKLENSFKNQRHLEYQVKGFVIVLALLAIFATLLFYNVITF